MVQLETEICSWFYFRLNESFNINRSNDKIMLFMQRWWIITTFAWFRFSLVCECWGVNYPRFKIFANIKPFTDNSIEMHGESYVAMNYYIALERQKILFLFDVQIDRRDQNKDKKKKQLHSVKSVKNINSKGNEAHEKAAIVIPQCWQLTLSTNPIA